MQKLEFKQKTSGKINIHKNKQIILFDINDKNTPEPVDEATHISKGTSNSTAPCFL